MVRDETVSLDKRATLLLKAFDNAGEFVGSLGRKKYKNVHGPAASVACRMKRASVFGGLDVVTPKREHSLVESGAGSISSLSAAIAIAFRTLLP